MIHVMLPVQYLRRTGGTAAEPHRRLMAAVLQAVVDDVQRAGREARLDLRGVPKARAYLASRDRSWPFSFENLCDALGLDAAGLRRALRAGEAGPAQRVE